MPADGREGAIVNVGSIGAQAALGDSPASAYSMAKAGLHALTRNPAIELASAGIRVNAVSPDRIPRFMKASWRKKTLPAQCNR